MNKKNVLFALVLLIPSLLSAQALSGWWTGGNIEASVCNYKTVLSLDLPSLTLKHNDTGLFLSFSPYHLDTFGADDSETETGVHFEDCYQSFVNAKFGIDLLKNNSQLDLNPYVACNWNPFDWETTLPFEAGCDLTLFMSEKDESAFPFRCKVATLNAGCRFRDGKPYFTTGISIDLAGFLYTCLMSEYYEVSGE